MDSNREGVKDGIRARNRGWNKVGEKERKGEGKGESKGEGESEKIQGQMKKWDGHTARPITWLFEGSKVEKLIFSIFNLKFCVICVFFGGDINHHLLFDKSSIW